MKRKTHLVLFVGIFVLTILACGINNGSSRVPLNRTLLYEDEFSDVASGWDRIETLEFVADYREGGYLLGVYKGDYLAMSVPGMSFSDAIIEVDTTYLSGGYDNYFGILCRYQDSSNYYLLFITSDGFFGILKNRGENFTTLGMDGFGSSEVIKQGRSSNLLRAECVGNRFALHVNGELLLEGFDSDILSGDVGILAGTFTASSAEILFDNFKVYQP